MIPLIFVGIGVGLLVRAEIKRRERAGVQAAAKAALDAMAKISRLGL